MSEHATHVEYAKSNRSECVKCHHPIPKDAIRIGRQFHAHHEGQRYYHLKCWTPNAKETRKPADYVFGFESLKPKDQIAVNKHCGFADEGAVDADRHVAGVLQQAQPQPLQFPTTAAATTFAFNFPTASSQPAPSQPQIPSASLAPHGQTHATVSTSFGATAAPQNSMTFASSAAAAAGAPVRSLPPAARAPLSGSKSLSEAIEVLQRNGVINQAQANSLRGPMHGKNDAKAVLDGAFELFRYDGDVDEFWHSVSRVVRAV